MDRQTAQTEVMVTARRLHASGHLPGKSGNVSVRLDSEWMCVTPTAIPYEILALRDCPFVQLFTDRVEGDGIPSSEWRLHRSIYREREDVQAVVHTHSLCASAYSCLRHPLLAFHYMLAVAGDDIVRCSEYALFGTEELALTAVEALGKRKAAFLANHGLVAVGSSLKEASFVAEEIERLCQMFFLVYGKGMEILKVGEMAAVLAQFQAYQEGSLR